ncbi:MAG: hypothetical protein AAF721_20480 [Myxococcota bacterium]
MVRRSVLLAALAMAACTKRGPKAQPASPPAAQGAVATQPDAAWPVLSTDFAAVIPADTPFVLSQDEPLPAHVVARLDPVLAPLVSAFELGVGEAHAESSEEVRGGVEAVFGGPPTLAGLKEIGIDLNPRFVVYGLGLAPVLRIRLRDVDAFVRALSKAETVVGAKRDTKYFHGHAYFSSRTEDGSLRVVTIAGADLIVALLPPGEIQRDLLPLVFGQRLPERSLADTGGLAVMRKRHGLDRSASGYVDLQVLVSTFVGRGSPLNLRIARAFGAVGSNPDPVCTDELLRLVGGTPRLVAGFEHAANEEIVFSTTLEMTDPLARRLATFPAAIPVATPPRGNALASFGVGLDLGAVLSAARVFGDVVADEPFRCEDFTFLNGVASGVEMAVNIMPGAIFDVSGLAWSIHDLDPSDDNRVDGVVVVDVGDPPAVLAAAAATWPGFRPERLRRRRPVPLRKLFDADAPDLGVLEPSWVGMGAHSIALSLGKSGKRAVSAAVDRRRPNDGTLMFGSMDFAEWIARNPDRVERLLRLEGRLAKQAADGMLALLSRLVLRLKATEQGLGLELDLQQPR